MTRNHANVGLAAIVTTVAETTEAPTGVLFAGMMGRYSFDEFQALVGFLISARCLEATGNNVVRITEQGRDLAKSIDAHILARFERRQEA